MKKEIQGYEQIYRSFNSTEDLILKFKHQLDLVISDEHEKGAVETDADKEEKARSDFENYRQHVLHKFKYLDFTGLNAILQKPLELENIYIKLRTMESLPFPSKRFRSSEDLKHLAAAEEKDNKSKKKAEDFVTLFKRLHLEKPANKTPRSGAQHGGSSRLLIYKR